MNKGDIVLIKASGDEPGVRRIWDPDSRRPLVCLEDYWVRWERHEVAPMCWPVSPDRLYGFDETLSHDLEEAFQASRKGHADASTRLAGLWNQAKRY